MKGSKKRAKMTAKQFEKLITAIENTATEDVDLLGLADHIRGNHKLSIDELKAAQFIKESNQRIATDERLLEMLRTELIEGNFVKASEERERVFGVLVGVGFPFARQLADLLYPPINNSQYIDDVLAAFERLNPK